MAATVLRAEAACTASSLSKYETSTKEPTNLEIRKYLSSFSSLQVPLDTKGLNYTLTEINNTPPPQKKTRNRIVMISANQGKEYTDNNSCLSG